MILSCSLCDKPTNDCCDTCNLTRCDECRKTCSRCEFDTCSDCQCGCYTQPLLISRKENLKHVSNLLIYLLKEHQFTLEEVIKSCNL